MESHRLSNALSRLVERLSLGVTAGEICRRCDLLGTMAMRTSSVDARKELVNSSEGGSEATTLTTVIMATIPAVAIASTT